jgi:hypothetical protein
VRRRLGAALVIAALAVAGCGASGNSDTVQHGKDSGTAAFRVETPDIVLQSVRRPTRHRIVVDGKRISAGRQWLLPVEIKLTNRRKRAQKVGSITAPLVDGKGRRSDPVFAAGQVGAQEVFAEPSIRAGEAAHTLVIYKIPAPRLAKAKLRVRDPVRGASYELRVF